MNIAPDAWSADTEALHARIARLRTIAENAARAGTSIHPRYIIAAIDGKRA